MVRLRNGLNIVIRQDDQVQLTDVLRSVPNRTRFGTRLVAVRRNAQPETGERRSIIELHGDTVASVFRGFVAVISSFVSGHDQLSVDSSTHGKSRTE